MNTLSLDPQFCLKLTLALAHSLWQGALVGICVLFFTSHLHRRPRRNLRPRAAQIRRPAEM